MNTYKVRGEDNDRQSDQRGHHHLRGDLRATAAHDGGENLKHHPEEEHEVDIGKRKAQKIQAAVLQ